MSFDARSTTAADVAVPVSYAVNFTVLSIFTSLAGCITTLELLHRRTSTKGLFNWFLFIGACVAMGGSGIWSMHFIANRAIVIADGDHEKQIVYSPGFTALSVFLPVIVLACAFYFLGANRSRARPLYLIMAGVLTGTAVCGMHYVGNAGIRNYHCHYQPANVAGAALIAVAASLVALSVFFRLRDRWTDSWYKRTLCALILTLAVCGMHWTAAVGTQYVPGPDNTSSGGTTRIQTVIVCAVLSFGCCLVLLITAFFTGMKVRMAKTRAQQVVLACAYFDETGRVMVTQEGGFPCQKITDRYIEKEFGEDELSRSHSTFLWIFRTSRHWPAVKELIPGMLHYLESNQHARKYRPGRESPVSDAASEVSLNFSNVFKQLFCVTASQLSASLHESLENIGVLFEEHLETGTLHLFKTAKRQRDDDRSNSAFGKDLESDLFNLGRGKYLFLNRQLTKTSADRYAAMGYRFASIDQVTELIARNMDVRSDRMLNHLERMKTATAPGRLTLKGVHVGCFMVRPSIHQSFDILVPTNAQNRLPMVSLKLRLLTTWHRQVLERYDEMSVGDVLRKLHQDTSKSGAERDFMFSLHAALLQLIDDVGEMDYMLNAIFSAKAVNIRTGQRNNDEEDHCTILTIRMMNDIHAKAPRTMRYVPLGFFGAQQLIEAGEPQEKERWERRVRMEYGHSSRSLTMGPTTPSTLWARTWHDRRESSGMRSLRSLIPWVSSGRKGSHVTHDSSRRESGDDQARIFKTVEIDLKEEKDDSALAIESGVDDVERMASVGSSGSESTNNGNRNTNNRRISSADADAITGTVGATVDETRTAANDFERNQGERGRYVASVESSISPPPAVAAVAIGTRQARSGSLHGASKKPKIETLNVEMIELKGEPVTPSSANFGPMAGGGVGLNLRGGWVSDVFAMFRL